MVYLIHLEITRQTIRHCIAILENDAAETLRIYYIQPDSRLMANLLALGLEWTVIRLWEENTWSKWWPRKKANPVCPICGAKG